MIVEIEIQICGNTQTAAASMLLASGFLFLLRFWTANLRGSLRLF